MAGGTGLRGTPRQIAALRAVIVHGSIKAAAHDIGRSPRQVQRHLEALRTVNGCWSWELAYRLGVLDQYQQMTLWVA